MASTIQDKLYETFVAVSGQQDSNPAGALDNGEEIAASLSDTVKQIGQLQASGEAQAASSGSSTSTTSAAASGSTSTSGSATAAAATTGATACVTTARQPVQPVDGAHTGIHRLSGNSGPQHVGLRARGRQP